MKETKQKSDHHMSSEKGEASAMECDTQRKDHGSPKKVSHSSPHTPGSPSRNSNLQSPTKSSSQNKTVLDRMSQLRLSRSEETSRKKGATLASIKMPAALMHELTANESPRKGTNRRNNAPEVNVNNSPISPEHQSPSVNRRRKGFFGNKKVSLSQSKKENSVASDGSTTTTTTASSQSNASAPKTNINASIENNQVATNEKLPEKFEKKPSKKWSKTSVTGEIACVSLAGNEGTNVIDRKQPPTELDMETSKQLPLNEGVVNNDHNFESVSCLSPISQLSFGALKKVLTDSASGYRNFDCSRSPMTEEQSRENSITDEINADMPFEYDTHDTNDMDIQDNNFYHPENLRLTVKDVPIENVLDVAGVSSPEKVEPKSIVENNESSQKEAITHTDEKVQANKSKVRFALGSNTTRLVSTTNDNVNASKGGYSDALVQLKDQMDRGHASGDIDALFGASQECIDLLVFVNHENKRFEKNRKKQLALMADEVSTCTIVENILVDHFFLKSNQHYPFRI